VAPEVSREKRGDKVLFKGTGEWLEREVDRWLWRGLGIWMAMFSAKPRSVRSRGSYKRKDHLMVKV
jgi:hypothetical protein